MHIVIVKYIRTIDDVQKHLQEQRAFLDTQYQKGVLLASGPQVTRTGGVLMVNGITFREELDAILSQDPFWREQVAEYSVISFAPTKKSSLLEPLTGVIERRQVLRRIEYSEGYVVGTCSSTQD